MNKKLNFTNMKNIYIILSLLFVSFTSLADATFNNASGDGKWSTIGNWVGGALPTNADKVTLLKSVTLDVNATIKQLKNNGQNSDDIVVVTGEAGKVLTITGAGVTQPIQSNGAGKTLDLTGVVIDITSTDATETYAVQGNNGFLKLGSWTTVTDANLLASSGVANPRTIELDGAFTSAKLLQFKTNSTIVFGANYDGTAHTNNMRILDNNNGPARVTVKGSNWLKAGQKLIAVKTGTVTLDGENALQGQIEIQSANNLNLNVNKNQSGAQTITIGSGNLNLTMGDNVTSLVFANNSAADWGTGKIVITNFKDNVISFGSNASGLTTAQLAQIDIGGGNVVIGSDGKLATENNEVAASTFKNTTGDSLWTTAGNWSNGIPNVATAKVTISKSMILDADVEIAQIKLDNTETGVDVLVKSNNNKTLTISGTGVTQPIQNNRGNATFNLNLKVVMNSTDAVETIQASSAGTCNVTFGASSDLTLNVPTKFVAQNARTIELNGIIRNTGTGEIQIGAASTVNFGSTSDNSNYTGDIRLLGKNTNLTSNTADDGTFLVAGSTIVPDVATNEGHKITLNGKNTFKGNISVLDSAVSLNVNADQSSAGLITMQLGNLNLTLGSNVTNLTFADNSASNWGLGNIVVIGFTNNVIGFGSDTSGITPDQLAQINAGVTLSLTGTGFLTSAGIGEKLMITGILDGDLSGGYPKYLELYAVTDIADLTIYGIDVASNGASSTKQDYALESGSLTAGSFYKIARKSGAGAGGFDDWFGTTADMYTSKNTFNGDDAIVLYKNGIAEDVLGEVGKDGTGEAWEYKDGWVYRKNTKKASTTFNVDDWTACNGCADTYFLNSEMAQPFPIASYIISLPEKLIITGVLDGDLSGGYPKALELYAATDIADLSIYGIDVASNGALSTSQDYALEAGSLTKGSFYTIGRKSGTGNGGFDDWFGKAADMYTDKNTFNGDDAIVLYKNGTIIVDVLGAVGQDGTGEAWEYKDGWMYRKSGKDASLNFNMNDWKACKGCADTYSKNSDMAQPFPIGTYSEIAVVPTSVFFDETDAAVSETAGTYNMKVMISDPSADSATVVHLVYTGSDSTDIGGFTRDTLTFPAGSSDPILASIPITDDSKVEGEEILSFELQNISGGYEASIGSPSVFSLTINDDDIGAFTMVYNELHIDPASDITGDANGDGSRDAIKDEFIELVNTGSSSVDLSGYYLTDETSPNGAARHVFPSGTIVDAGQAIVIFGGGVPTSPTNFGGSVVHTASENNSGVALGNSGKTLYVKNPDSLTVLSYTYDGTVGSINQSITRSPDLTGEFVSHSGVAAANGALFSPGMKLDSTAFYTHTSTKVQFQVLRATYKEGADATFDIGVTINGESATNATDVTVSLSGGTGSADDVDGFSSQTLTFAAGSTTTQNVTITITNDDLEEGNETIEFELTSPSGGESAAVASPSKFTLTLSDDDISNPLVLNEILTDPPSDDAGTTDVVEGDANGDGTRSPSQDEFVEFVNTNTTQLDVSGYTISDATGLRHIFPENSIIDGGRGLVVFGGGTPTGDFGGATVQTASAGTLSLNNTGDKVVVSDNNGNIIIEFEWGGSTQFDGGADQSLTRDPDITGDFVLHSTTVSGGVYSPGTQTDGSNFDVGLNDPTKVQFKLSEDTYSESDGTYNTGDYNIEIDISNPSPTVATQVEIVFTASDNGSASDISDYAGEVITFSSGSSDSQTSKVTISSSSIQIGTKYDFALQNVSGGNQATLGDKTTFTLMVGDPASVPLGIENSRSDINLSPNPTSDILKVSINNNKVLERFIINDMNGRSMMSRSFGNVTDRIEIDVRSFDNGLYILNLEFENDSAKLKFIKK